MRLSDRLETILFCCGSGSCVADVGTDHGWVPIELVQRGLYQKAIAMDVRSGPLQRAEEHVKNRGLADVISLRLSDGLKALAPGEAETIVVAGMGGGLIQKILKEGQDTAKAAGRLVLSPQSELPEFRRFLHAMGHKDDSHAPFSLLLQLFDCPKDILFSRSIFTAQWAP